MDDAGRGLDRVVRLLCGDGYWSTPAEPASGLRSMLFSDGSSGVRGERWDDRDPSICPPAPWHWLRPGTRSW